MTAPTAPSPLAPSPHTKPAIAATIGVVIGVLALVQGYFGSGHIPTSEEVASVLGGAGITLGSIAAFILSHLGIVKAQLTGGEAAPTGPSAHASQ